MSDDGTKPDAQLITVRMIGRSTNFTTDGHGILSQDNPLTRFISVALEKIMFDRYGSDNSFGVQLPPIDSDNPSARTYKDVGIRNERDQPPLTLQIVTRYPLEALEVLGELVGRPRNAMVIGYIEDLRANRTSDDPSASMTNELPYGVWLAPLCDPIPLNGFEGMTFEQSYGVRIPNQMHMEIVANRSRAVLLKEPVVHPDANKQHIVPGAAFTRLLQPSRTAYDPKLRLVCSSANTTPEP